MCGAQLRHRKRSTHLMLMLGLNESIDQFLGQCSLVWSCVEERGWSRLEKGISLLGKGSKEEGEAKEDMEKAV